jgi:dTDP-4-amino-4,6-dideoxygalactose transaminase
MTKSSALDLAIFGNAPLFAEPLHVGRPNIGDRDALLGRINDILDRRWLTNNGRYVQEFEARLTEITGARHAIAMCNATVGLEIAIKALGLTGEVIVPSFTFVATAHALQFQGVTPVFCDIDPKMHNIDPAKIEALITPRTTGIMPVHTWGRPCDVVAIEEIARRRGLKVLYDAAHAFACATEDRMIGNFGDAEVFSFHATKFLNAFEGGAIVTNDDELAARMRLMKNFGFRGYDNVVDVGVNGKMSEVSAAMGLTGLESIDEFIDVNERNHACYRAELADIPGVSLTAYTATERSNFQYVVIEVDEDEAGISRDRLVEILWAENVMARRYFYPGCHMMEPYRTLFPNAGAHLPETERLVQRVISMPTGTAVGAGEIEGIASIIRLACNDSALCAPSSDLNALANN